MRLISSFILCLFLTGFWSCAPSANPNAQFTILPSPSSFVISGSSSLDEKEVNQAFEQAKNHFISGKKLEDFTSNSLILSLDPAMEILPEGYELEIKKDAIQIKAATDPGLWYGLMTLGQILEDAKDQKAMLPTAKIKDEPALAYRAVHLDVKHHLEKKEYY